MIFTEYAEHRCLAGEELRLAKDFWNAALEQAIDMCQKKFDKYAYGFPREASTARALSENIATLKA